MVAEYCRTFWYQETQHPDALVRPHFSVCAKRVLSGSGDAFCYDAFCVVSRVTLLSFMFHAYDLPTFNAIITFFRGTGSWSHCPDIFSPPLAKKKYIYIYLYGWPARLFSIAHYMHFGH